MYTLSDRTKKNIERVLGIDIGDLLGMSINEEMEWIQKNHERPIFSKVRRKMVLGRGNPLLSRRKIRTMDDLDNKSKSLFGI